MFVVNGIYIYELFSSDSANDQYGNGTTTHLTCEPVKPRLSRQNTVEEKRRMRNKRMKRKNSNKLRKKMRQLQSEVSSESLLRNKAESIVVPFKNRAWTFWERWRWELEKRREAMTSLLRNRTFGAFDHVVSQSMLQEIGPAMIKDPVVGEDAEEHYVGRGSFGIVKVQVSRGILVAVKQYLPKSLKVNVLHEASMLGQICHPYLPFLIGVCTKKQPLCLVMQFHALEELNSSTVEVELPQNHFDSHTWLQMCTQLLEAIKYLHEEVSILHNDIKPNNIVIAKSLPLISKDVCEYQVVLLDFGKATKKDESKRYNPSGVEYMRKFPHIAPEVIEGETKQSVYSDVYSFGKVLFRIINQGCASGLHSCIQRELVAYAERCISPSYCTRPCTRKGLDIFC